MIASGGETVSDAMSDLLVGVGRSSERGSFTAGQQAAAKAKQSHGASPDVLIIFGAPVFDHRQLLAGISSVMGEVPLLGGTTAGEISSDGFSTDSVVVMALSSDTLQFTTGIGHDMSKGERVCSRRLLDSISAQTSIDNALSLLVLPNGMGGDGVEVIKGLQSVLGEEFEIVGGYLGDDTDFSSTFQYYNGKVYRDAIAGLMICGDGSFTTGVGVRSGFESIGNRLYCTEAEKNVVASLDDEPALTLYKELLREERSQRLPGICLEYPFGLIDEKVSIAGKEYFQLRCGLSVDHRKKTITLAGSIPEGSAITLTTASRGDIINGARLAAEQARESLGKATTPRAILMFSCVGRKLVLGRRTQEEVTAVKQVLGEDIPLIGFYTYGEIGPIDKRERRLATSKFHNETVVLWILGNRRAHP
jgi:hypothetical protein